MRVIAGAFFLVVALTLVMAAGAFAQITPQGNSSTNNMTTNTTSTHPTATTTNTTGTDPTSTSPTTHTPTTSTAPMAPAADCASEIAGMNAVLKALPLSERTSLKGSGQLPAIPCTGYHYATDFTIVPDASPPTSAAAPQARDSSTQTIPQT